jgi:molybdate transport system ATP-binding protein
MLAVDLRKRLHTSGGDMDLNLAFTVGDGEILTLFGRSGVGKTTCLRCIAGLLSPDQGRITIDDETWFDDARRIDLPPQRRRVGLVFQDYALFPNLTVRGNLEIAAADQDDRRHIDELLEMTGLRPFEHRRPATLSGGQQQRVALARALARRPRLLLLDEPLSALDPHMRSQLQEELLRLQRHFGTTTIIVSHDLGEVYRLSDRVLLIDGGGIHASGAPAEVFAGSHVSGKFQFTGEVLSITPSDVVYTLSVLVGNRIVQVVGTADEVQGIGVGDTVMLASKAFNPIIVRMNPPASPKGVLSHD